MVIIADKVGQLCNRIFQFSYFIANSAELNYKVINPSFKEYLKYFEFTVNKERLPKNIKLNLTSFTLIDRLILKFVSKKTIPFTFSLDIRYTGEIYDLKQKSFNDLIKNKVVFTKGWLFKDEENIRKHREILIQIFTPLKSYRDAVENIILNLRKTYDCIIGVHIRRGDYLTWNEGKYFFKDEVYLALMLKVKSQITAEGKSCCFFIASNECINLEAFSEVDAFFEERHFIVDLYTLSRCDFIFGPPSTYSLWASFYGNTPLFSCESPNEEITLDKFSLY